MSEPTNNFDIFENIAKIIPSQVIDIYNIFSNPFWLKIFILLITLFITYIGNDFPYTIWYSNTFKGISIGLISIVLCLEKDMKIHLVPILLLIFIMSTQITKIQQEHFNQIVINKKLENFAPSDAVIDETFHISPEYFRENRDPPLEGTQADVPGRGKDDYVLYQETEPNSHSVNSHPPKSNGESQEPINPYDPLVGHEIAPF
jgi:hypothetical protein